MYKRGGKLEFKHKPVLLEETIQGLNIKKNGIYVDGTLGGAGHSKEILKQISDLLKNDCLLKSLYSFQKQLFLQIK